MIGYMGRLGSASTIVSAYLTTSGTDSAAMNTFNNSNGFTQFEGEVTMGGTDGTVTFNFNSAVNGQTSTIFESGTFMTYRLIN
jgi:hypothetical protein